MANGNVNKIVINGQTRIDLTGDTVDAEHLIEGYTAHDKSGAPIIGTAHAGGDAVYMRTEVQIEYEQHETSVIILSRSALENAGLLSRSNTTLEDEWTNFTLSITANTASGFSHRAYQVLYILVSNAGANITSASQRYFGFLARHNTSSSNMTTAATQYALAEQNDYGFPRLERGGDLTIAVANTLTIGGGKYIVEIFASGKK